MLTRALILASPLLALGLTAAAQTGGSDVRIVQLNCEGDPESVMIRNLGTEQQNLIDWRLESDPPEDESYSLSPVGVLGSGESIIVESGPGASLALVWSSEPVFRDDGGTDYVRVVNESGEVVHQVNCGEPALDESSPSSETAPSTTPAPSPLGELEIPDGGGAPPWTPPLPATMLASLGGALMMGALAFLAAVGFRRASLRAPDSSPAAKEVAVTRTPISTRRRQSGGGPLLAPVLLGGVALLVLARLIWRR